MRQVWLKSNRRIMLPVIAAGALAVVVGAVLAVLAAGQGGLGIAAGVLLGAGLALCMAGLRGWLRPRLAYEPNYLLVYLTAWGVYRVPIELVEVFFLGQTEANLPGRRAANWESRSIVVRLAQDAHQDSTSNCLLWRRRPVAARLGDWFAGYIIIRGVWCEPIDKSKADELNRRLVAARQKRADVRIEGRAIL